MGEGGFPPQAIDPEWNGTRCERGTERVDIDRGPRTTDDIKKTSFVASSWATAVCPTSRSSITVESNPELDLKILFFSLRLSPSACTGLSLRNKAEPNPPHHHRHLHHPRHGREPPTLKTPPSGKHPIFLERSREHEGEKNVREKLVANNQNDPETRSRRSSIWESPD